MKILLTLALLSLFCISSFAKSFVVCAETGAGKSTLSSALFGVNAPTGMYTSQTKQTTKYLASSSAVPAFQGSIIYDTPGTLDTSGITNEEIMTEIEKHYLKEIGTDRDSTLDGFIFIISTKQTRIRFGDLIKNFASSFSSSVLKSMVLVVNWFDSEPWEKAQETKKHVQIQANAVSSSDLGNEFVEIPVVIMNAKNPTHDQINELASALSNVQKYLLVDLEKKAKEVQEIYDSLLTDPKNLKEQIDKFVKEEIVEIVKQGMKKVPKEFVNERVDGCKVSGGIPGFFSFCIPNKISEKVTLVIDEETTLTETEKRPVIEEKIIQVLKNEKSVIWNQAVEIFHQRYLEKYAKKPASVDL